MNDKYEIYPGKGFGKLKFGSEIEDVIKTFGEPEDIDNFENDDDINAVLLHYWEKGFSVFFQGDTKQVVTGIETDHPEATLYGHKIIGITEQEVIDIMKAQGNIDFDRETDDDEIRLSYEMEMVDFYLKNNKVAFVNWDILVDENNLE